MASPIQRPEALPTDPSPEEIRQMTEAIRSRWSEQEKARRASSRPIPWLPPLVTGLPDVSEPDAHSAA